MFVVVLINEIELPTLSIRRVWYVLPKKKKDSSIFIDPSWTKMFYDCEEQREKVIHWFKRFDLEALDMHSFLFVYGKCVNLIETSL